MSWKSLTVDTAVRRSSPSPVECQTEKTEYWQSILTVWGVHCQ